MQHYVISLVFSLPRFSEIKHEGWGLAPQQGSTSSAKPEPPPRSSPRLPGEAERGRGGKSGTLCSARAAGKDRDHGGKVVVIDQLEEVDFSGQRQPRKGLTHFLGGQAAFDDQ
jgi:hypothetical protein